MRKGDSVWDERYSGSEYAFGTKPNDFLASVVDRIPRGRVLSLAEGEGRNAVFLAEQGCDVTAVDSSSVGLAKARRLADERGVNIETTVADLNDFAIEPASWDGVVSIFCHLPEPLRARVHEAVVQGLTPGAVFILEAYTPKQLEYRTGGPPTAELMMSLDDLRRELDGLVFEHAIELTRRIEEGQFHSGQSAVVQVLARKPSP